MKPAWAAFLGLLFAGTTLATASRGAEDPPPAAKRLFVGLAFQIGQSCAGPSDPQALCVVQVAPTSAAGRAGVKVGDRLVRLGQTRIDGSNVLRAALDGLHPGDAAELEVAGAKGSRVLRLVVKDSDWTTPGPPGRVFVNASATCAAPIEGAGAPFRKLEPAISAAKVDRLLAGRKAALVLQGDVLTVALRAPGASVTLVGAIQCAPEPAKGAKDRWVLRLQSDKWRWRFLREDFIAVAADGKESTVASVMFRGREAPAAPLAHDPLTGSLQTVSLTSRNLGETRQVTVYLPPGRPTGPLHALYMADGQSAKEFAQVLEPLILRGRIPPLAIVGVHAAASGLSPGQDIRAREYLPDVDPAQFARHETFFVEELVPWATQTYGLSSNPADRALMGYSNGASFVQAIGLLHPDLFGVVMPFSTGNLQTGRIKPAAGARLPRFLLAAGDMEPFLPTTAAATAWLKSLGAQADETVYASGHDMLLWRQAMADLAPTAFGAPRSEGRVEAQ
jgi:enterochelin esterase-like enzyme